MHAQFISVLMNKTNNKIQQKNNKTESSFFYGALIYYHFRSTVSNISRMCEYVLMGLAFVQALRKQ